MTIKKCLYCGNEFEGKGARKYCSNECSKKAHYQQNAKAGREKRKKIYICKKCGAEFETHSGRNSYCKKCMYKPGGHDVFCGVCGKKFHCVTTAKYCSKECSKIAHKEKIHKNYLLKTDRLMFCKQCGEQFETHRGHCLYCDNCNKLRRICPSCGGIKQEDHEHCNKCKIKSHTYICSICGKKCVGMKNTLYCEQCYPKCKVCGNKVNTVNNNCCSISCATILKRKETSTEKMQKHLKDIFDGKYNHGKGSYDNRQREKFFIDNGITYKKEFRIENNLKDFGQSCAYYDFKVGYNLIEINPTISHNSTKGYRLGSKAKDYDYHNKKTRLGIINGYNVINIFDWDYNDNFKNWLLYELKEKKTITEGEIKNINKDIAEKFILDNSYVFVIDGEIQNINKGLDYYGVYNGGELVFVMGFDGWRDNDDIYILKLTNYVNKKGYKIKGLDKKILNNYINELREYDIQNNGISFDSRNEDLFMISSCDLSKTNGKYIEDLGFYVSGDDIDAIYINKKTGEITQYGIEDYTDPKYGKLTRVSPNYYVVYTAGIREFTYDNTLLNNILANV